jgi:riboflavin kinase/FMN adenylyltransferase
LYDRYLHVTFIEHLRGEQKFSGIDALKEQIARDAQEAHRILTSRRVSH